MENAGLGKSMIFMFVWESEAEANYPQATICLLFFTRNHGKYVIDYGLSPNSFHFHQSILARTCKSET